METHPAAAHIEGYHGEGAHWQGVLLGLAELSQEAVQAVGPISNPTILLKV